MDRWDGSNEPTGSTLLVRCEEAKLLGYYNRLDDQIGSHAVKCVGMEGGNKSIDGSRETNNGGGQSRRIDGGI